LQETPSRSESVRPGPDPWPATSLSHSDRHRVGCRCCPAGFQRPPVTHWQPASEGCPLLRVTVTLLAKWGIHISASAYTACKIIDWMFKLCIYMHHDIYCIFIACIHSSLRQLFSVLAYTCIFVAHFLCNASTHTDWNSSVLGLIQV
jgi:hypothetical protein